MKLRIRMIILIQLVTATLVYWFISFGSQGTRNLVEQRSTSYFNQDAVMKTRWGLAQECQFAEQPLQRKGFIDTFDLLRKAEHEDVREKYRNPNRKELLKVFLIPHSHLDPGWLMTIEEYYQTKVRSILDNLVLKMTQYQDMTFVWVEAVFLDMWWTNTTAENRERFQGLVKSGRLEIVNGGWVAPDEAITHYFALIDQLIEGHQWVLKNLGVKPRVSWSPDPFGHSSTIPYILSGAGLNETVIVRIHDGIKARLRTDKNVEFKWRQAWQQTTDKNDLFCHVMPYLYNSFHYACGPDSSVCSKYDFFRNKEIVDLMENEDDLRAFSTELMSELEYKAQLFRHDVLFLPVGGDFRFSDASEWDNQYIGFKRISEYINNNTELNAHMQFGTASDYFDAVYKSNLSGEKFNILHGDFLPYYDGGYTYWTGFYTTRPFWKQLGRELEGDQRAAEVLLSLSVLYQKGFGKQYSFLQVSLDKLTKIRRASAVFQHHDAITGTSTEHTVQDYARILWKGKALAREVSASAASYLLSNGNLQMRPDEIVNIMYPLNDRDHEHPLRFKSTLNVVKGRNYNIILFNPSPHIRKGLIRLHISSPNVAVFDLNGDPVQCQINPVWRPFKQSPLRNCVELVFFADLKPLGMDTYSIKAISSEHTVLAEVKTKATGNSVKGSNFTLESSILRADFSRFGLLKKLENKRDKNVIDIKAKFYKYDSDRGGGAYMFSPKQIHGFLRNRFISVLRGPLMSVVRVGYDIIEHSVTLLHTDSALGAALEIVNYVNMTSVKQDTDIFLRFNTSVQNKQFLYTDSNGFQMVRRSRHSYYVSGNVYPISDACFIQDNGTRLSLLAGQPHGVASIEDGALDVFLDRKQFSDDGKGLGEGAKDNIPTRSRFYILLETAHKVSLDRNSAHIPHQSLVSQTLVDQLHYPIVDFCFKKPKYLNTHVFTPLKSPFPCDVDLVNLKVMEVLNGQTNSEDVFMILRRRGFRCHFSTYDLKCPLTSGGLKLHETFAQIRFKSVNEKSLSLTYDKGTKTSDHELHLEPMELKAYRLDYT